MEATLAERVLDIVDQHRNIDGSIQVSSIARALGARRTSVQRSLAQLARRGMLGYRPVLPGFEISRTTTVTNKDGEVVRQFVQQKPERGEEYTVPEGHVVKGESALIGGDGQLIQKWIKTRTSESERTLDDIIAVLSEYRGKSEFVPKPDVHSDSDLATVYPTSDLHIGMLAWGRQTGAAWDLDIAKSAILGSASTLIGCTPPSELGILIDLGDYTHNNDQTNSTPASGHQLDVDGRFPKISKEAMRIRVDLIAMALRKHETVLYRGLPGNHDPDTAQLISIAMSLLFENNPRVIVDDDPSDFWFYEFGINFLAANHGHKVKPDRLPGVMASYRPEIWGRTKVRQAWSGHIHHTRAGEDMGARWETMRTIAPRDAYAHSHGYSAGRDLTAWTYHKTRGLIMKQVAEIV